MNKRTRVLALILSVSLILPGIVQGVPTVVKAESESSVPDSPSMNMQVATKPSVATNLPQPTEEPAATSEPASTATSKPTSKPAPTTTMQPGEKKAISSFEDLQAMEDIPSGDYYLTNDITVPVNAQLFRDYSFTGTLDGNGYKIEGYQVQKKCVFTEAVTGRIYDNEADDLLSEKPDGGLFCWVSGL